MENHNLSEYLKTAFEYKNNGDYKKSIDYFYKALAMDNESSEIMIELAGLYTNINSYERASGFYEQILSKEPDNMFVKFEFAKVLKSAGELKKAENILLKLFDDGYEINKTAEELFDIYLKFNDYEKIISNFKKYSNNLTGSSVLNYVAAAYSKTNCAELAEEFYKKSFAGDEKNILSGIKVAESMFQKGQIEQAENLALKLLQYTENPQVFYLLAEIAYSKSDIDSAIKYYSYAIKTNPQNSVYYFKLAIVFSLKGFFNEAEECYCRAVDLDGENQLYNYALAYLYYMNKKFLLSEKQVDYVLSLNPDYLQAVCLKTLLLLEKNETMPAGKLVEKLENVDEPDDFVFYVSAVYYFKLNSLDKAVNFILKAIELNQKSLEYKYLLAKLYFLKKEYDKTIYVCEEIIAQNTKYIEAYILYAKTEVMKNNYNAAISHINTALILDKNIHEAYFVLGNISFLKQNYEDAIKNYKIAVSIKPDEEEYYAKIAYCCYLSGNYKDACGYYKEASDFDITNASYRYYMAKCSEFLGDIENAASNFSVMKRLEPMNIQFISEYANFLYNNKKKKTAVSVIKKMMKNSQPHEKAQLKLLLDSYKQAR